MNGRPLETLTNLGRIAARQLAEIGINTEADLRAAGAAAAYLKLKDHFGRGVSLNYLYALGGALKDERWDAMPEAERAALRAEASALLGGKRKTRAPKAPAK
ncbi:MAG: TfoX/Sxy family DNA transformation protein [Alphaproteobacteria bacterium]